MIPFSEGEWRFGIVVFFLGLFIGLPAALFGLGWLVWRVAAAAWRGW